MLRALASAVLVSILSGCTATASLALPREPAATPARDPSIGGTTVETALPVARGQTVEGAVTDATSRYYMIQLQAAETLRLRFYTHTDTSSANATIAVLDSMGGKLKERMVTVSSTADWDVNQTSYTAPAAGTVLVRASCYKCLNKAVRYRILVE